MPDDKNKFSKREERALRKTSKCQGNRCTLPKSAQPKNRKPFKQSESGDSAPVKRDAKKVRYERAFQSGTPVKPPKQTEDEIVVHNEEKYAGFIGKGENAESEQAKKLEKDINDLNATRKKETYTVKKEQPKAAQYEGKTGKGTATGFKTSAKQFLEKKNEKDGVNPFIKTSEGYKKEIGQEEYKFRSTREDKNTRVVATYKKEGSGEVITTDKKKRGEVYRSMSHRQKKRLNDMSKEKRDKKYEKKGAIKREKF